MPRTKLFSEIAEEFAQMTVGTMWRLCEHELTDPTCPVSYLLILESTQDEKKYVRCIPQYCGKEFFVHTLLLQDLAYAYRQATDEEWGQIFPYFVAHARNEMFAANEIARTKRSQFVLISGFGAVTEL